ncbi:hypothetical protein NKI35_30710 [Mesorhizobium sp. M0676]
MDVFVVDEETRLPLGRPWVTVALDIFSRMVTGLYLTMEAPSRLSTSLCILHSVFDKTHGCRSGVSMKRGPWPVCRERYMSTTARIFEVMHSNVLAATTA